jgi:hypothetical protein
VTSRILSIALLLALASAAVAQDAPAPPALGPGDWTVEAKPNDEGRSIAVEWPAGAPETAFFKAVEEAVAAKKKLDELARAGQPIPPELSAKAHMPEPPAYEYVISVSGVPDGDLVEAAKVAATSGWKKEAPDVFGNAAADATGHFAAVNLLSVASPQALAAAAFADAKPPAERSAQEAKGLARMTAILGAQTIADARAFLARRGYRPQDLEDEAVSSRIAEGYLGTGGLTKLITDRDWRVKLAVRSAGGMTEAGPPKVVRPQAALFHTARLNNFIVMVALTVLVLGFIQHAKKNPNLFLRRIGGLDAVDEALGRATEMGKPVLFVHGLDTMGSISTIAAVNILGEIAKKVARYDSKLLCVNNDPIVLAVSQETVKEAYLNAGRPDAYNSDDVFFVAAEQFSYVAAVDGIMVRQKPAANFYCGYFYAESLLLSETGATTGAIQIAATDAYTQLPFFVTTCDYTLMGEELYAASAYLSRDPLLLGSLKGQDVGKALIILCLIVGTALETAGLHWVSQLLKAY